jgi:methyltransferase
VNTVIVIGGVIMGLMLAEARVSRAHERALAARGAIRPAGDVYPMMAVVYPAAFLVMIAEGVWRARAMTAPGADTAAGGPEWMASGILLFVASKALKYWAIASLGDRWTFKVIVEPGRPLVNTGPYRYVTHPNYLALVGEFAGAAMMVGAWFGGPLALLAFGALLAARIRFEDRVLAAIRDGSRADGDPRGIVS